MPQRVRVRVFTGQDGRCAICTRKIAPGDRWICDHIVALINGGKNREENLQAICDWCDRKIKTPADIAEKSAVYKKRSRHIGAKAPSRRPMPGSRASKFKRRLGPGGRQFTVERGSDG